MYWLGVEEKSYQVCTSTKTTKRTCVGRRRYTYKQARTLVEVASWRKTTSIPFDLAVRALSRVGSNRLRFDLSMPRQEYDKRRLFVRVLGLPATCTQSSLMVLYREGALRSFITVGAVPSLDRNLNLLRHRFALFRCFAPACHRKVKVAADFTTRAFTHIHAAARVDSVVR